MLRIRDDGDVGIGNSSPQAKLDVNGSAFVQSFGSEWNSRSLTFDSRNWNHNLGYKPILMLSIDNTNGSYGNYITRAYENVDNNNNTLIRVYDSFPDVTTRATFATRWIIVGQQ